MSEAVTAGPDPVPTARTADLVDQLHAIVEELERRHPGRRFPLDGHLVGSLAEVEAQSMFDIRLQPASTPGHDAISSDGRAVEIKGTYGSSGVAVRPTSHQHAAALIVLRLSRRSDQDHEVVYNGPFALAAQAAGPMGSNGQARISLSRLRALNAAIGDADRVPMRSRNETPPAAAAAAAIAPDDPTVSPE